MGLGEAAVRAEVLRSKHGVDTHSHAHEKEGFKHGVGYEVEKTYSLQGEGERDGHDAQLR